MSRILTFFLVLAIVLGCGPSRNPSDDDPSPAEDPSSNPCETADVGDSPDWCWIEVIESGRDTYGRECLEATFYDGRVQVLCLGKKA